MTEDLAARIAFLEARVERLHDLQASLFHVAHLSLGLLCRKKVIEQAEMVAYLEEHLKNLPQDYRQSDKTLFQRLLIQMAHSPPGDPPSAASGRPAWLREVIEGGRDRESDRQ